MEDVMGEAFFKFAKTMDLLIEIQEDMLSTVVDTMEVPGKNPDSSYTTSAAVTVLPKGPLPSWRS